MARAAVIPARFALAGGVVLLLVGACGHSEPVATTTTKAPVGGSATPEVGPQTLDCGENGYMNVGNAPFYGEPLDDPAKAPSPREMADQFAQRHKVAVMFPEADLVVVSADESARAYAWQEGDGTRRAYVAYEYVDWYGGWQSLGDAVCVRATLVSAGPNT